MSLRIIDWVSNVVVTTDATPTTIATFNVPAGCAASFVAEITGRNTATGATVVAARRVGAKNVGGVVSLVGTVLSVMDSVDTALATVLITMDVSGTSVRVRATGLIATSIEWFVDIRVRLN